MRLPRPYVVREVGGVVVWPDGSPVAKAWVVLAGKENPSEKEGGFDWLSADEQGRFSLQGFVGAEYWVLASVGTYGMKTASGKELWDTGVRDLKARPLKVTVGAADNRPLRIVIPVPEGVVVNREP